VFTYLFYRVGLSFWNRYGSDPANVKAKDPLVAEAKAFGFGTKTGIDIPGEASGRIADRQWKLDYWNAMKGHYCRIDKRNTTHKRDVRGSNAIQWQMMRDSLAVGADVYDLRGITDTLDSDDPHLGLIQFKVGTGGEAVEYAGEWDLPLNRLVYKAFDVYMRRRG